MKAVIIYQESYWHMKKVQGWLKLAKMEASHERGT